MGKCDKVILALHLRTLEKLLIANEKYYANMDIEKQELANIKKILIDNNIIDDRENDRL